MEIFVTCVLIGVALFVWFYQRRQKRKEKDEALKAVLKENREKFRRAAYEDSLKNENTRPDFGHLHARYGRPAPDGAPRKWEPNKKPLSNKSETPPSDDEAEDYMRMLRQRNQDDGTFGQDLWSGSFGHSSGFSSDDSGSRSDSDFDFGGGSFGGGGGGDSYDSGSSDSGSSDSGSWSNND